MTEKNNNEPMDKLELEDLPEELSMEEQAEVKGGDLKTGSKPPKGKSFKDLHI
ncbi:hypothetical protein FHS18_000631 [Paenibacillus phyllosphaerae]|uniref:Uncharacterized protein n=1 Tax=Paenibacillus phyllosphaerae TaxID=274593 RepID=A0A7W5ATQ5_9BACL|nr:hypothetical protein [Paenibacillus phyllosphaerae]MBB3108603.1 hypothetical protein [Paenibacillus phyllosphaerae]